jgi:hypothetical protein
MKNIKTFCTTYGEIIMALIVALVTLIWWFAFRTDEELSQFLSSDALYLPSLYRDFFQDGNSMIGWTFNQATNFFPDTMLFFILNALSGDFVVAIFCYAVIQYFAIIFIMYLIFKLIRPNLHPATFAPAILGFTAFLFLFFIDRSWVASLLNHNSWHNSAFIMSLLCVYLFCKYLQNRSNKTLIAIMILSLLCGACDRLFFICFTIPIFLVVIVLYFFSKDRKILTKFLISLVISVFLGIMLWVFFKNYFSLSKAYGHITLEFIQHSWNVFSLQMYGYLTDFSFMMFLSWFSIFSYLAVIVYVVVKIYKLINGKETADTLFIFELFVLFSIPIVLFAPIFSGSYDNIVSFRYNYFPYILLPFNSVLLISNRLNKSKLTRITVNATLCVLMLGYLFIKFPPQEFNAGFKRYLNCYPERARIIDSYFEDDTLKYGITDDYWLAKQATMFSKKGVRLYCTYQGGYGRLHVSNKYWFIDNGKGKHAHRKFTFFVWSKGNELPAFFEENNNLQPVDLENWNLYEVAPYRYIQAESRIEPVLTNTSSQ